MQQNNKKLHVIQEHESTIVNGVTCFSAHAHYDVCCKRERCQYWFSNKENNNCVLVAAQNGPHTLQKIGEMYGLTRMRICQIEKNILDKIRKVL